MIKIEVHCYNHSDSSVTAMFDQLRKEISQHMSKLSDAISAVSDDVTRISDDVSKVLAILQQPNPDVDAAVTALTAIDSGLDATADKLEAAVAPPAPKPAA